MNPFKHKTDEELMQLFTETQEANVFSVLYTRYFVRLQKYLYWLDSDLEKAEDRTDIVQTIFLKLYSKPHLFDSSKSFKVWLFSIAKNHWRNHIRSKVVERKHFALLSKQALPKVSMDMFEKEEAENLRITKSVEQAMQQLSDPHKEVMSLKYSSNFSIKEIAQIMECSEGTVKSRLFYALSKLKKIIQHES